MTLLMWLPCPHHYRRPAFHRAFHRWSLLTVRPHVRAVRPCPEQSLAVRPLAEQGLVVRSPPWWSDRPTLRSTSVACFADLSRLRAAPTTLATPHAVLSTPPAPCAAPVSTTSAAPLVAPTFQLYPRCGREASTSVVATDNGRTVAPPVNNHPMTMRVKRGFWLSTDRLTLSATSVPTLSPVPSSFRAALVDPNWCRAMEEEFAALIINNTWNLVPRSVGSNVITSKWIFKYKFNFDDSLERYKARRVLHGFT
jgi:hypothetical protein